MLRTEGESQGFAATTPKFYQLQFQSTLLLKAKKKIKHRQGAMSSSITT